MSNQALHVTPVLATEKTKVPPVRSPCRSPLSDDSQLALDSEGNLVSSFVAAG